MSSESTSKDWNVWRQDDNGQSFLVAEKLTRCQADDLALEYEKRGHKQYYWVERA